MMRPAPICRALHLASLCFLLAANAPARCQSSVAVSPAVGSASSPADLAHLVAALHAKAGWLETTSGMRLAFQSFVTAHHLSAESVRYSDFVTIRLFYEATRDAGFWNMHWEITNKPPNSDNVWRQWQGVRKPSPLAPTATAECDELSALFSFLVEREGVKGVGLFWPYPNHTVAVWFPTPAGGSELRVVIPTSQIFLQDTDDFDTHSFNPWTQKAIFDYTRRDVADSYEIPRPLFDFFLQQVDKYAGASDAVLQQLRYRREGVFLHSWSSEQAAHWAEKQRAALPASASPEDSAAYWNFAADMRSESAPH